MQEGELRMETKVMDKKLISIIIPVYNVEKYVEECVESCLKQDYDNCEIVLIDDGSTDASGIICDKLASRNKNIFCYHKENGGLSDARNYGIQHSKGEFIVFVDSDDIIDKSMISYLFNMIPSEGQKTIATCGLTHFYDNDKPVFYYDDKIRRINKDVALSSFLYQNHISPSSCGKIYPRELVINNLFIKGQRFEDNDFIFRVLRDCESVVFTKSRLYAYRHRRNSITTSQFSEKDFDIIKIGEKILKESEKLGKTIYKAARVYQCTNCFRIYLTVTEEYKYNYMYNYSCQYLEENSKYAIIDKNTRYKLKIGLLLYKLGVSDQLLRFIRGMKSRWE